MLISIIYSILIAVIYSILIFSVSESFYLDMEVEPRMEKTLFMSFAISIGTIIGLYIYLRKSKYRNWTVERGLYMGSFLMMIYTVFGNWNTMSNQGKIMILALSLVVIICLSYRQKDNETE